MPPTEHQNRKSDTLTAKYRGMFSSTYDVRQNGRTVATMHSKWFKEGGRVEIRGETYRIRRDPGFGKWRLLDPDGNEIASAEKPSAFGRHFEIEVGDVELQLRPRSMFHRSFELFVDGKRFGLLRPKNIWTRNMELRLPSSLSLPVQVFLTALVQWMWRRQNSSSGATHSAAH